MINEIDFPLIFDGQSDERLPRDVDPRVSTSPILLRHINFARHKIIGYRLSVIGYRLSIIDYRLSVISYRLSVIGYLLSVIGYRLSFIGYRLSVIGYLSIVYRLSVICR